MSSNKITIDESQHSTLEFQYQLLKKVEQLIIKISKIEGLYSFLRPNSKFEYDLVALMNSAFYVLYEHGKDKHGKVMIRGVDYIPQSFEEWLSSNYSDMHKCMEIYTKLSKYFILVEKSDLENINNIFRKYA
jgi:hypothetical protein